MLYLTSDGMEWDQALREFSSYQSASNLSDKTIQNRAECLLLLAKRSGRKPLEVTTLDLREHLARRHPRTGARVSGGTMQTERSYFRAFFRWLKTEGYTKQNPAKKLAKIKVARRMPRPVRLDQIEAMIDSGAYSRTRDIICIAAWTGLRIGEIVKIRGEDIDTIGRTIHTIRKGGLDHLVSIPPAMDEAVERYPRKGWWFPSKQANKYFPHGGGHILMKSASDAISKAIRRAGIVDRRITGHSLRHFCATWMLKNDVPIRVIQETLGHASLATTQLYTEVDIDDMHEGSVVMPVIARREHSGRRARIAA